MKPLPPREDYGRHAMPWDRGDVTHRADKGYGFAGVGLGLHIRGGYRPEEDGILCV